VAIKEINEIKGNVDQDIDIAGRIFAERFKRGWTQTDLSRHSGVNPATISKIEAARVFPRISTLRKFAFAFEIPVGDLLEEGPVTIERDGETLKLGRFLPPRRTVEEPDEDHEDVS
jgi:transcriptional regulator with XRE-family HTH domain